MSLKLVGFSQETSVNDLSVFTNYLSFIDMETLESVRIITSPETIADLVKHMSKSKSVIPKESHLPDAVMAVPNTKESSLPDGFFSQEESGVTDLNSLEDPDEDFDEEDEDGVSTL